MPKQLFPYDPIQLEVFKHLFASIADEMGVVLRRSSYSPNIKERRDFSCALFNNLGDMIAQAAHIPVHLGSMPLSVQAAISAHSSTLQPGDMIILNDPYQGGTHLPDVTLVAPVYHDDELIGFCGNRAHHADIGGMAPGSMAIARELFQEGLIIPPVKLFEAGELNQSILDLILANVRTPQERLGDLWAQVAANRRGVQRLIELTKRFGQDLISEYMGHLLNYTSRMTRALIASIPDGKYVYTDYLDNDGVDDTAIPISVSIDVQGDHAIVDFTGSSKQVRGSLNAVYAITLSTVYYTFRCLLDADVPNNSGCLEPIKIIAPPGTIVNAHYPAPVAGGNVETSQRIVDVLFGALSLALPTRLPAASQGTMNNLSIGGWDNRKQTAFTYYETIAGGMGARPHAQGVSAMHSHMTNTLNTPVEALETSYPLRVMCYQIRTKSGGEGKYQGGDGIRRDIQVLVPCYANLITERRLHPPYGLYGGKPGAPGENVLVREGIEYNLPGKGSVELNTGDILSIRTPGGGGFGTKLNIEDLPDT